MSGGKPFTYSVFFGAESARPYMVLGRKTKHVRITCANPPLMTTIPARLARVTQVSTSLAHAQSRSRALYRDLYRAVSWC